MPGEGQQLPHYCHICETAFASIGELVDHDCNTGDTP